MKIETLLDNLNLYLKKGEKQKSVQCARIDELLSKLEEKKKKLQKKLDDESSGTKKKRLSTELKIVSLQLKKGLKRREELQNKCK